MITIEPGDDCFEEDDDDVSPSSSTHKHTFEATLFSNDDDDEDEEEYFDEDDDPDMDIIYEDGIPDEDSSRSSAGSAAYSKMVKMEEEAAAEDVDDELQFNHHPYPTARLFTDELELLLTNVDGNDSDPDVVVIPGPAADRPCRRMYRKSMSLPMSPVVGMRERLDSINFNEFLLSPIKLGGLEHGDVDFEDISMRNGDFNLLSFVGQDTEALKESPVKEVEPQPVVVVQREVPRAVIVKQEEAEQVQAPLQPAAPAKSYSKGKCLQLLRATHQRQENMAKRCGAIDTQKMIAKKLFPSEREETPMLPVVKKSVPKVPRKSERDSDPDWSPMPEVSAPVARNELAAKKGTKQQQRAGASASQVVVSGSSSSVGATKSHLVSGSSNLHDIKRRFLANIPLVHCSKATANNAAVKRKQPQQHPQVMKVADLSFDHNYCSPVKRFQPIAKTAVRVTKSTILIDDAPLKSPKKGASIKMENVVVKEEKAPRTLENPGKQQPTPTAALPMQVKVKAAVAAPIPTVVVKRRAINLEDYKRLRSGGEAKKGDQTSNAKNNVMKCVPGEAKEDDEGDKSSPTGSASAASADSPTAMIHSSVAAVAVHEDEKKYVDPISEAKNKALRMQERRRAARLKQEDIQLKAPLVPILPLAVMTGLISEETYLAELNSSADSKAVAAIKGKDERLLPFDEIQVVSVGCNTNTTIRPDYQSTTLLSDLSHQMRTKAPLQKNSLLFSIQDVVIKKTNAPHEQDAVSPATAEYSPGKPEGASEGTVAANDHTGYHHGEDKVIMHLRKDRIRPKTSSATVQTDFTAEFPELERWAPLVRESKRNKRHYRRRRSPLSGSSDTDSDSYSDRSGSSDEFSGDEESGEDEFGRSSKRRRLYSTSRPYSRSRSRSTSVRRSRSRFTSRSPCRRSRNSRSRSRSRSVSDTRSTVRNHNNVNLNNNRNRWRPKNPSPGEVLCFGE